MNRAADVHEPDTELVHEMPESDVVSVPIQRRSVRVLEFEGDIARLPKRRPHVVADVRSEEAA